MIDSERVQLPCSGGSAEHGGARPKRRVDSPHDRDAGGAIVVRRMPNGDAEGAEVRRHGITPLLSLPAVWLGTRGIA